MTGAGTSRRWAWSRAVGIALILTVVAISATKRADQQRIGTDFHVFWRAGYDFAHGLPLYQPLEGARHFIYPPFAAQLFQILSLFPLKVAAWLFYVASAGLVVVAFWISRDILRQLDPTSGRARMPLLLAGLFSAEFILDNQVHVQTNILTFVMCLLGIQAFVKRREVAAGGWMVAATSVKVTPVFFLVWTLIRGSRRTVAAIALFGALCLALPIAQRGLAQGASDLEAYYESFLGQFAAGKVVTNFRNQNLAAMVYRAVTPKASEDDPPYDYAYLPRLEKAAPLIYRVLAVAVLAAFLGRVIWLRSSRRPVGPLEISSVFLASHLLSGITWKAHLVTLLFVSYTFFSLDPARMRRSGRVALGLAWAGIVVMGLGRDVVGSRLHHYFAGYSVFVWVMLVLFALSVMWSQRPITSEVVLSP